MTRQIVLLPDMFLQLLQALAAPEKWEISVPSSVLDVKYISSQMKTEDGVEFLETTVECPDDWDLLLCTFTSLEPAKKTSGT